jgi:hypothetical protein
VLRRPTLREALAVVTVVVVLAVAAGTPAGQPTSDALDGPATTPEPERHNLYTATPTPNDTPSASVTFSNQSADEDGTLVTVDSVALPDGGFVAIHRDSVSGPVVGVSAYLSAGTHTDVLVRLDEAVDDRTTLVAMAHRDTDGDLVFEWTYAEEDGPYTDDGAPVADAAMVTATPTVTPTPYCTGPGCGDTPTPTVTPTPFCTGPGCGDDTPTPTMGLAEVTTPTTEPTGDWTSLLRPLLAFLAVTTAGLLALGAVLARWRLAPDGD